LRVILLAILAVCYAVPAQALGLGELRVQSALGQQLRASLNLLGVQNDLPQSCISAKLVSTEGGLVANAIVSFAPSGSSGLISLTTRQSVQEPAVKLVVDIACGAQIHREFTLLLDPPLFASAPSRAELPLAQASADSPDLRAGAERRSGKPAPAAIPVARQSRDELPAKPLAMTAKVAKAKAAKAPKDVLKLSDDVQAVPQQGLRLSDSLSEPPVGANQQSLAELRVAQAQLAALLRGEAQEKIPADQMQAGQQKMQSLQTEANQLKRQSQADKAELEALRENSYSRNWVVALTGLLLIGLIAIAVLVAQLRRQSKGSEFSWVEQHADKVDAERKMSVEEIVNSVQASYQPAPLCPPSRPSRPGWRRQRILRRLHWRKIPHPRQSQGPPQHRRECICRRWKIPTPAPSIFLLPKAIR